MMSVINLFHVKYLQNGYKLINSMQINSIDLAFNPDERILLSETPNRKSLNLLSIFAGEILGTNSIVPAFIVYYASVPSSA